MSDQKAEIIPAPKIAVYRYRAIAATPGARKESPQVASKNAEPAPNISGTTRKGSWRISSRDSHTAANRETTADTPITGGSVVTPKCDR